MSIQAIRDINSSQSADCHPGSNRSQQYLARDAALALLERSVLFGHPRLAVLRLSMAVHAGAEVPAPLWSYCEKATSQSHDLQLKFMWLSVAERVQQRGQSTPAPTEAH